MILQRLAEHYDRIVASGGEEAQLAPPGFSVQKISFCVVIEPDGRLNMFQSLQAHSGKSTVSRSMIVPGQGKPSGQGINPCVLWDNSAYMLGFKAEDEKPDRTAKCFEAFRTRHLELEQEIRHPAWSAVCSFLRTWSSEQAEQHVELLSTITSNFGVFRIAGKSGYVHEAVLVPNHASDAGETTAWRGVCLVSGAEGQIARIHEPKIRGVSGAQSSGALLVSFNAGAYESYGKTQSYNAPVSAGLTFKYANALNHLLGRRDRRVSLGDSTVIFWSDHQSILEDCLSELFTDRSLSTELVIQEDPERIRQARQFLTQLRDGFAESGAFDKSTQTKFFLLGLSPSASRISVRFWVETDAAHLERLLGQHLRDIALETGREDRPLTLWRVIAATGRAARDASGKLKFDQAAVSPQLAGELARAVLTGAPYPQTLLAGMIRRIRYDGEIDYARVAAIKACLVRNSRLRGNPMEVSVKLDPKRSDAAYCCGRLFALLEKVQSDSAGGELNSTIKDRYFSSASVTPALVFPRLCRLSQHHLANLDRGARIYHERLQGEVMEKLTDFPRLLSLEDQGRFVIGYFHQQRDLYTSKKDREEGATA